MSQPGFGSADGSHGMTENRDFTGPASEPTAVDPASEPKPLIIIERRGPSRLRGLVPPTLILAAACLIVAYRVQESDWSGIAPIEESHPTPAISPTPGPVAAPVPIVVRVKTDGAPRPDRPATETLKPIEVAARPARPDPPPEVPAPPPIQPRPGIGATPHVVAAVPAFIAPPQPARPVPREVALNDIRREAAQKRAARDEGEDLKIRAAARDQAETRRRWAEQAERARHFVEEDRPTFLEELRKILQTRSSRPGSDVKSLCERHRSAVPPEVKEAIKRVRLGVAPRLTRRDRVELYRRRGMPEVMILDELASEEAQNIGMRQGPRDKPEALARAARRLLEIPLPGPSPVADAAAPPGTALDRRP